MNQQLLKSYKYISMGFLLIITFLAIAIYLITYIHQDRTSANPFIYWAVQNHLTITSGLMITSVLIGYFLSNLVYKQLAETKKESQKLLEMLFVFLNKEEKEIIDYLVKNKGSANQA